MAVVSVIEKGHGLTGAVTGKSRLTAKNVYSATYQVTCAPGDTAKTVIDYFRTTSGYPYIGDPYDFGNDSDSTARCKGLTPSYIEDSGGTWLVRAEFEPLDAEEDEQQEDARGNKQTDPLLWHDEIDVSYTQLSIPVENAIFRGINGGNMRVRAVGTDGPVVNAAGVPFDPTIEKEIDIKIVRITKNVASFNGNTANFYIGNVNSDQVTVNKPAYRFLDLWRPRTARIKNISGTFQIANGIPYWKQSIEVHINPLGWRRFIVNRGTERRQMPGDIREFDENGTPIQISDGDIQPGQPFHMTIKDADGLPITSPVLLDADGQPLKPDQPALYLEYQTYKERAFAGIRW